MKTSIPFFSDRNKLVKLGCQVSWYCTIDHRRLFTCDQNNESHNLTSMTSTNQRERERERENNYSTEHNICSLNKQCQQDTRTDYDQHPTSLQHHQDRRKQKFEKLIREKQVAVSPVDIPYVDKTNWVIN